MYPVICHIYGDLYLNTYSVMLMIGVLVFLKASQNMVKNKLIDDKIFNNLIVEGALIGIIGGRLLHVLCEFNQYTFLDIFKIWQGGLSILGTIISVVTYVIFYCSFNKLPILTVLDIGGAYAPLIHAIARVGCFFAGCCYGLPTNLPWGITYTNILSSAPLNQALHPTQLYSAFLYLIIFCVIKYFSKKDRHPGQIFGLYLFLASSERFLVDIFRNDRIFNNITKVFTNNLFSIHQVISLSLALVSIVLLISLPKVLIKKRYNIKTN